MLTHHTCQCFGLQRVMPLGFQSCVHENQLVFGFRVELFTLVPFLHQTVMKSSRVLQRRVNLLSFLLDCACPELGQVSSIQHCSIFASSSAPSFPSVTKKCQGRHFQLLLLAAMLLTFLMISVHLLPNQNPQVGVFLFRPLHLISLSATPSMIALMSKKARGGTDDPSKETQKSCQPSSPDGALYLKFSTQRSVRPVPKKPKRPWRKVRSRFQYASALPSSTIHRLIIPHQGLTRHCKGLSLGTRACTTW